MLKSTTYKRMGSAALLLLARLLLVLGQALPLSVISGRGDLELLALHEGAGDLAKDVLDLVVLLGRALDKSNLALLAEGGDLLVRHPPVIHQVGLVADQDHHGVLFSVLIHFPQPKLLDVLEALLVSKVEHHEDGLAAPVVGARDGPEAFLPCSIPDLELYVFGIYGGGFEAEVDADGGEIVLLELVLCESDEYGGLAHSRVPDDYCFVQVVELFDHAPIICMNYIHNLYSKPLTLNLYHFPTSYAIESVYNLKIMEALVNIKEQGNLLFKQKSFPQAIAKFQQAISLIEQREPKDYLQPQSEAGKLYVVCLINAAFACISIKTTQRCLEAVQFCNKALSVDQANVKGLYRRGLARKELGYLIQKEKGQKAEELLDIYQKSQKDFEDLCLIDKKNELASKNLSEVTKDIYRVTVAKGDEVNFSAAGQESKKTENTKSPYEIPQGEKKRRGLNMEKIMKQYKVEEVTTQVQDKVRNQYLTSPLPELRSDLEKAIRALQKSPPIYLQFVERMDSSYLNKVQPTFDILESFVNVILKLGEGEKSREVLSAIRDQKNYTLLWKSYSKKQKESFKQKWVSLGLPEEQLP